MTNSTSQIRSIRNKNPGNIRHGDNWQGRAAEQPDPDYITFVSEEYGARALMINLRTYMVNYGINTISGIISRWAPPTENNTAAYISAVSARIGQGPHVALPFDKTPVTQIAHAIAHHETGNGHFSLGLFQRAWDMYL